MNAENHQIDLTIGTFVPKFLWQKCPNCLGYGTFAHGTKLCPTCEGKGSVKIEVQEEKAASLSPNSVKEAE